MLRQRNPHRVDSEPDWDTAFKLMSISMQTHSPDPVTRERAYQALMWAEKPVFPPIETLPCANVQPKLRSAFHGLGKMTCSDCRLISYCSKDYQKDHWKLHKRDCKKPIKSEDWLPSWVREGRPPIFMRDETPEEGFYRRSTGEFDRGYALWGNVPAMDVINLGANENDATKDLSIAFVGAEMLLSILLSAARSDIEPRKQRLVTCMRHVVKTINSLLVSRRKVKCKRACSR
ncbi:hypothetical protein EST38_g3504 [Candolleomyces aberdarensis]|uniref:MYND-type domain-containing protein n=1 Tax=Candolleomyces aberdarensis TaxID=2316362 RepID=A0A4Q2DS39_9AGAR|nr:hypothetical protein EST38_g3504 [Candolleomyces aberdarensis]